MHEFSQEELIAQSEVEDTILCPGHGARLRLAQLAPDIVLGDLDPKFNLVMDEFNFIPAYVLRFVLNVNSYVSWVKRAVFLDALCAHAKP